MAPRQASPTALLLLLSAASFLTLVSVLLLGPLLVALAHEFQTSVAIVGQLAAATAITWGITAPLAGPVSDTYGRRLMLVSMAPLTHTRSRTYTSSIKCEVLASYPAWYSAAVDACSVAWA